MKLIIKKPVAPIVITPVDEFAVEPDTPSVSEPISAPILQPKPKKKVLRFKAAQSRFTKKTLTKNKRKEKRRLQRRARIG